MNACMIAYTFYETDHRVHRYAEALAGKGNRIDMIVLRGTGEKRQGVLNGVNLHRIQRREYNEKGPLSYLFKILSFYIKGSMILFFMHFRYRYKIIHIHNLPDFLVFMGFIPKLFGAKIILDIHDILPEFYCQKFSSSFDTSLAKLLLFIEKISVTFADYLIVANDIWRERIIDRDRISASHCETLLNYPILKYFKGYTDKRGDDQFKIIYPGTISHIHGLDIAIRAIFTAKQEIEGLILYIYGRSANANYLDSIRSLVDNLDLRENVKFLEPVPTNELAEIYSTMDVGIVPKREGLFSSEAFSSKIFDFMAAGLPAIVSKTRIDEYYFDDSMIMFFEPENPDDLARCIIDLYKNPEKGQSLADNGKQFVAENNWEVKEKFYLDLVDSLANKT